jgi:hypothetical protein
MLFNINSTRLISKEKNNTFLQAPTILLAMFNARVILPREGRPPRTIKLTAINSISSSLSRLSQKLLKNSCGLCFLFLSIYSKPSFSFSETQINLIFSTSLFSV